MDWVRIPEGTQGHFRVMHKTPNEAELGFNNLRAALKGRGYLEPGETIEMLLEKNILWMSSTSDEKNDSAEFLRHATGHVLITGLGLGLVVRQLALNHDIESVTVIECEKDIVALVGPTLKGIWNDGRLKIVVGDAYSWRPPKGTGRIYSAIWHDIWPTICEDNRAEMSRIKRHYCNWLKKGGWQGCWSEELLR